MILLKIKLTLNKKNYIMNFLGMFLSISEVFSLIMKIKRIFFILMSTKFKILLVYFLAGLWHEKCWNRAFSHIIILFFYDTYFDTYKRFIKIY